MNNFLFDVVDFKLKFILNSTAKVTTLDGKEIIGFYEYDGGSNTLKISFDHHNDDFRNESLDVFIDKLNYESLMQCKESVYATVCSQRFYYAPRRTLIKSYIV